MELLDKKITIITTGTGSFLVNSMKLAFEERNFWVNSYAMNSTDISSIKGDDSIVFIFADEYNDTTLHMLIAVKNYCNENNAKLVILGQPEELAFVKRTIPASKIIKEFVRPVDVKDVIYHTEELLKIKKYEDTQKHILVVDDSGPMLRTINSWLEETYSVALANSATNAIKAIDKRKPDLILLDYEMPVVSGADLMNMLKEDPTTVDIPVIFLTSKGDSATVNSVLALKPQGYMLKSTPSKDVVERIDQFFKEQIEKKVRTS